MQAVDEQILTTETSATPDTAWTISMEWVLVLVLVVFAVVLRLAEIDTVPMSDTEATQALAAWHTLSPDAPGTFQSAGSPIVFWLQIIGFTIFGSGEFAARLAGIVGGVVLILMPLLYRQQIGRERALIASTILTFSPIAFVAARTTDPAIWTAIFALAGIHYAWKFWETSETRAAIQAIGWVAAMVFLSEGGGLALGVILLISAMITIWWVLLDAADVFDEPGDEAWQHIRERLQTIPFIRGGAVAIFATVILATGFMVYPSGLNTVGTAIGQFFSGFIVPSQPDAPFGLALLSLLVYEPLLIFLGIISAVVALQRFQQPFINRFMIVWWLVGMVALLVYRGASPADSLWVVLPLVFLVSDLVLDFVQNRASRLIGFDITLDAQENWWAKWALSVVIVSVLMLLAINLQLIGKSLFDVPDQTVISMFTDVRFAQYRYSMIWVGIIILLLVMGYFLSGTVWGNTNTWQGYGLGVVAFMFLTGVVSGWNTAVESSDNPAEIWHTTAISDDAYLLRDTLFEVAQRTSRGFPTLPVIIVQDEAGIIRDDALVAWLVRDFENAEFVSTLPEAQRESIVLMVDLEDDPDLGGSYVGQSFVLREQWALSNLSASEIMSWWTQRRIREEGIAQELTILWLRQDLFDGVELSN